MADIPKWILRHTVTVTPITRTSTRPVKGEPISVPAFVSDKRSMVRAADGSEVISESTFVCRRAFRDHIKVGDEVTLPSGRVTTVLAISDGDDAGLGAWSHLQVACQ